MDALIDLTLRALGAVFLNRFGLGFLLVLLALYGVGSDWPGWGTGLCGALGLSVWVVSLWFGWRDSQRPSGLPGSAK
ncbi:hypothetical protein E7T06_04930 [Deinococcus sp. Arct2-2]|uniref:hypothetical protein n=1 Tax=Deinococcus sp. Arct2-2 TaxID=2568653 RepID=UPI0010A389CE|nr:hypothetical protein [Deinococcus sp. Arct2-2]THF70906.1 hypothetical protein E7T06_04930 [Deinococcus sp. Arct2-2]